MKTKQARKKTIKIAGAGISGLTAAINLAKAGYGVEVFEANQFAGGRHFGDLQFLENWTTERDVLDILAEFNIKIDFPHRPIREIQFYSGSLNEYDFISREPMMYGVRRGPGDSLDAALAKQAEELGVNITYNAPLKEADIVATGPKSVRGFASGITFETDLRDCTKVLLNNKMAPHTYSYFTVIDGHATLSCCTRPKSRADYANHVDNLLDFFQGLEEFSVKDRKEFSGFVDHFIPKTAVKGNSLYTGEAAGFQDYLAGFGMRYAFLSGYLAAKAILSGSDYDLLWKKEFGGLLKASAVNRFVFWQTSKLGYGWLIKLAHHRSILKALEGDDDGRTILYNVYAPRRYKIMLYSLILPFLANGKKPLTH